MILNPGAPMVLARQPWLEKYLDDFGYKIVDLVSSKCYQVFSFGGNNKRDMSMLLIELPFLVRNLSGREYVLMAQVYVIDADVVFLCGKKTLEQWGV